jgi:ketosteroid isomerase-like protein
MGERAERNARIVREGYEAFGSGDLAKVQEMFSPDVVWHTPEHHGVLSGDHKGWDEVAGFFMKTMELSEGTFRIEVLDLTSSDEHVAAYVHVTANGRGRILDDSPIHLFRLGEDGIVQEITQYALNQSNVDAFWSE